MYSASNSNLVEGVETYERCENEHFLKFFKHYFQFKRYIERVKRNGKLLPSCDWEVLIEIQEDIAEVLKLSTSQVENIGEKKTQNLRHTSSSESSHSSLSDTDNHKNITEHKTVDRKKEFKESSVKLEQSSNDRSEIKKDKNKVKVNEENKGLSNDEEHKEIIVNFNESKNIQNFQEHRSLDGNNYISSINYLDIHNESENNEMYRNNYYPKHRSAQYQNKSPDNCYRCYICSRTNHTPEYCRTRLNACYICGDQNHFFIRCPNNRSSNSMNTPNTGGYLQTLQHTRYLKVPNNNNSYRQPHNGKRNHRDKFSKSRSLNMPTKKVTVDEKESNHNKVDQTDNKLINLHSMGPNFLYIPVKILNNHEIPALVDTGAKLSVIAQSEIERRNIRINKNCKRDFGCGNIKKQTKGIVHTIMKISGKYYDIKLHVMEDNYLQHNLILGLDFIEGNDMIIDTKNGLFRLKEGSV